MRHDKDWIDVMRSALRDAETPPPADGWERLERDLGEVPAARVSAWRIYWPRIAAAAAAVLICVVAGEFLWRGNQEFTGYDGNVITTAENSGGRSADLIPQPATVAQDVPVLAAVTPKPVAARGRAGRLKAAVAEGPAVVRTRESGAEQPDVQPEVPSERLSEVSATGQPESTTEPQPETRSKQPRRKPAQQSPAQGGTYYGGDEFVAVVRPHKKASFSVYGGGAVTGGSNTPGGPGGMQQSDFSSSMADAGVLPGIGDGISTLLRYDYGESSFNHHQPLSFGLSVRKEFSHGLSLESGINYTLLRSDVTQRFGAQEASQKLHFIGIPLRMNWQFLERGRFSLYVGAGGMIEKCVSAKLGSKSFEEPGVQWSLLGAAGAQYQLGGLVGLYFEPEVSYYLTQTGLRTSRTDSPLTLTLRLGVRLTF